MAISSESWAFDDCASSFSFLSNLIFTWCFYYHSTSWLERDLAWIWLKVFVDSQTWNQWSSQDLTSASLVPWHCNIACSWPFVHSLRCCSCEIWICENECPDEQYYALKLRWMSCSPRWSHQRRHWPSCRHLNVCCPWTLVSYWRKLSTTQKRSLINCFITGHLFSTWWYELNDTSPVAKVWAPKIMSSRWLVHELWSYGYMGSA